MLLSERFLTSSFLYLLSFIFTLVALQALLVPSLFVLPVEIHLMSPAGFAEVRAGYSGCFGGLAFMFFRGAKYPEHRQLSLILAALVLGLFSLGRFVSLGVEGVPNDFSIIVHAAELCAFSFSCVLILRIKREI